MFIAKRYEKNPILTPMHEHQWESVTVLNASPVMKGKEMHLFYRAIGKPDQMVAPGILKSIIGKATSKDGVNFDNREAFIEPVEDWERFGCEDPRVTFFEDKYYVFYTALSVIPFQASGIKTACAITTDLKKVDERHLVTPFNSKAMTLFPERIDGKATLIFSAHTDEPPTKMCIAQAFNIEDFWEPSFWEEWHKNIDDHTLVLNKYDGDHCEVGATPIKTEDGWLLVYSHIQNYFDTGRRLFGIEALLLDSRNPQKIIGRTKNPIIIPEEPYEKYGIVSDIAFPSGAILNKNGRLDVYYGAGDTYCARFSLHYPDLRDAMLSSDLLLKRVPDATFGPIAENPWESRAVFNAGSVDIDGITHMLYRAMSEDNTSTFGYAMSDDGIHYTRDAEPSYVPRADFEMKKGSPTGNSGCEDPRLTRIGHKIYMTYTAYDGVHPPRVAITHISKKDFLSKKWDAWSMPVLISPATMDDKDACVFSEKINDEYMILHRIKGHVCADFTPDITFSKHGLTRCIDLFGPKAGSWESAKVGIAGPPLETPEGWLLLYHAVDSHGFYRLGAVLLDRTDPTTILGRTVDPIIEPIEEFERIGEIPNVIFSCGQTVRDDTLIVHYGGADKVMGVATCSLSHLLNILKPKTL